MEYQPQMNVAMRDQGGPVLVVDPDLALSPYGLVATFYLATDVVVFLLPPLFARLDQAAIERLHPGLTKRVHGRADDDDVAYACRRAVMAQWECARTDNLARRNVYWLAEGVDEAVLPQDFDARLLGRFHLLRESLAAAAPEAVEKEIEAGEPDALALMAALERPSVTLSLCEPDDAPPRLVQVAAALGANCRRLDPAYARRACERYLGPMLWRCGLGEIATMPEFPLAFVRLVAPGALYLEFDPEDHRRPHAWLAGAHVIWSPCHVDDA